MDNIQRQIGILILKMKGEYILTSSVIVSLISDLKNIIESALCLAKQFEIDQLIETFSKGFKNLSTKYRHEKYLDENFDVIVSSMHVKCLIKDGQKIWLFVYIFTYNIL